MELRRQVGDFKCVNNIISRGPVLRLLVRRCTGRASFSLVLLHVYLRAGAAVSATARPGPLHRATPALLLLLGQVLLRLLNPRGELAIDALLIRLQDNSCLLRSIEP